MGDLWLALGLSLVSGLTIPLGGLLARVERVRPAWLEEEMQHAVIAFGAGALLAAISFALVPEGIKHLNVAWSAVSFGAGALLFLVIDRALARRGGSGSQSMAMLMDFVPEAMALGAAVATGSPAGPLLAMLIAIQNFPEGFNAYREVAGGEGKRSGRVLVLFGLLSLLGPVCAAAGYFVFAGLPRTLGVITLGCAGGILYLIFQDIAPQVPVKRSWSPPLGAVAGFMLGMAGFMLTGASGS